MGWATFWAIFSQTHLVTLHRHEAKLVPDTLDSVSILACPTVFATNAFHEIQKVLIFLFWRSHF
jgi:hypothetical protein